MVRFFPWQNTREINFIYFTVNEAIVPPPWLNIHKHHLELSKGLFLSSNKGLKVVNSPFPGYGQNKEIYEDPRICQMKQQSSFPPVYL